MKGDPPPPPVILFFVLLCLATTDPLLTISLVAWLGKEVVRLGSYFLGKDFYFWFKWICRVLSCSKHYIKLRRGDFLVFLLS